MILERGKIIIFRSIHDAIRAEGLLTKSGYKPRVIPIPKDVSSDCGIALRLDASTFDGALDSHGRRVDGEPAARDQQGVAFGFTPAYSVFFLSR